MRFAAAPTPIWERSLMVPYSAASLPIRGVAAGLGAGVVYLDDHQVIDRVARLVAPRRVQFAVVPSVTAGGLTGWGGGVTLLHNSFFDPSNHAKLRLQAASRGWKRATLGFSFGHAGFARNEIGLGYRVVPGAIFYGLGPRSDRHRKSLYTEDLSWATVGHTEHWGRGFALEARGMVSGVGARESDLSDYPALDSTFASALPAGYGRRSDAVSTSIVLRHDTATESARPETGGVRRLSLARTDGFGADRNSFWTLRGDLEQFFRLWNSGQTVAVRGFLSASDPIGGSTIPFQRMMVNDDPDILRGYTDLRFRDRGMTALTLEYRWPAWADRTPKGMGIDAFLFGDTGQVFATREDLALERLTVSYGGGLRVIGAHGFVGRCEVGWSREGMKLRIRTDQLFQFARGGIYHGRNPIPLR